MVRFFFFFFFRGDPADNAVSGTPERDRRRRRASDRRKQKREDRCRCGARESYYTLREARRFPCWCGGERAARSLLAVINPPSSCDSLSRSFFFIFLPENGGLAAHKEKRETRRGRLLKINFIYSLSLSLSVCFRFGGLVSAGGYF